ncbi:MAG: four helix bundle protein [Eubacteriales bacterium]|nr:four helix bundle protein [Eubacteriales bacterium]
MAGFGFQNLNVYQDSKALVLDCYRLTKHFPDGERYALVQQMNRAAISIPSNIVEGYSRASAKEKSHFLNIAYGSLMELVCQFEIACALGYVSGEDCDTFMDKAYDLAVRISNFRAHVEGGRL